MRHWVMEICGLRVCLALPAPDSGFEVPGPVCSSKVGFRAPLCEAKIRRACVKQIVVTYDQVFLESSNGTALVVGSSQGQQNPMRRQCLVDWRWGS